MNRWRVICLLGAIFAAGASCAATRYLDEFDLSSMTCGLGKRPQARKSLNGNPLTLAGKTYARGVGTHAESVMLFDADGKVTSFDAVIGIDSEALAYKGWDCGKGWGSVSFRVYADGKKIADSGILRITDAPRPFHADLSGAKVIALEVSDGGEWAGYRFGHGDWADARFTTEGDAKLAPCADASLTRQLGILTPPVPSSPRINGPAVYGVRPGHPLQYLLPVSGERPMTVRASGLPAGVKFDPVTCILSGHVENAGDYPITFSARNARGGFSRLFTLRVGEKIGLTPPLGWNSWNVWGSSVSDAKIRAAADALKASGLAEHGWSYINIDDWWENRPNEKKNQDVMGPCRDANGRIIPNRRFPDMKGLADYVHGLGFKIGLYSSPGPTTCGGCEASWKHEKEDAASYAEWGFDYLKYDWCSYGNVVKAKTVEDFKKPYALMGKYLRAQNRDIFYAFCQYGMGKVEEWGESIGGNCWRTKGDLKDSWTCLINATTSEADMWPYARPGCWNDPDMMVLGTVSTAGSRHHTYLSPNEQITHVSLWSLLCAPMLLGFDFAKMDDFTKSLLVNDEVLEVSQDELGNQARLVSHDDATDVWAKKMTDGRTAVGVVNRYPFTRKISFSFKDAGLSGKQLLHDLWLQRDIGIHSGRYEAEIPPHATLLLSARAVGL